MNTSAGLLRRDKDAPNCLTCLTQDKDKDKARQSTKQAVVEPQCPSNLPVLG